MSKRRVLVIRRDTRRSIVVRQMPDGCVSGASETKTSRRPRIMRRILMRLVALLLLVACRGWSGGERRERKPGPPNPGPAVDEVCLQRVLDGRQIESQPSEAAGFIVTPTKSGVHMVRKGRALTKEEGEDLWQLFSRDHFARGGMTTGSSALSSVYKCHDVPDASCLTLAVWACQKDIATIATWAAEAATMIGAPDGELGLNLQFVERPPSCQNAARCPPKVHYSTKRARYDPGGERHLAVRGIGRCNNDGDCEGGGNACVAWYLAGGAETDIYVQYSSPTFCGCIEHTCNWFTQ
jgi:hypothetical protein